MALSDFFSTKPSYGSKADRRRKIKAPSLSRMAWVLIAFLALLFACGGSSRLDMSALIVIRPVAVLLMFVGLAGFERGRWRDNRTVLLAAAAIMLLPALQLVPLPPAIWHGLAGRALVARIDAVSGLGDVWRPLSLFPAGTLNALFALSVPAAVLLIGLGLAPRELQALLPYLAAAIFISALLGVLQIAGPHGGPLYFYRITHPDSAVGLFANRNHQAAVLACGFPMLGMLAAEAGRSGSRLPAPLLLLLAGVCLVPAVIVAGSRAGLAVGAVGIGLGGLLYFLGLRGQGRAVDRRVLMVALLCLAGLVMLGGVAIAVGRDEAFQRVLGWHSDRDFRLQAWAVIAQFGKGYWPWGTGFGSFVDVYKIYEPDALLNPAYFNQAHNDWLETALNGGLAGALVLVLAVAAWGRQAWNLRRFVPERAVSDQYARLGLAVILLFALASLTDYPLRVPSVDGLFVVAVLWALGARSKTSDGDRSFAGAAEHGKNG